MRSFWSDPFLWIHLAGLAVVPLWLEVCLLGLAVGDPILPVWLELLFVALIGIAPILWMQWQRPFYIFSLLVLALKPEQLTEDQRRLLTLFQSARNRFLAIAVAVFWVFLLRPIYDTAPIAAAIAKMAIDSHWLGLLLAAIAFLASNLFFQVPVAVLGVMLHSQETFAATVPYAPAHIRQNFTLLGIPVNKILGPLVKGLAPEMIPSQSELGTETEPESEITTQLRIVPTSPISPETEIAPIEPEPMPESASMESASVESASMESASMESAQGLEPDFVTVSGQTALGSPDAEETLQAPEEVPIPEEPQSTEAGQVIQEVQMVEEAAIIGESISEELISEESISEESISEESISEAPDPLPPSTMPGFTEVKEAMLVETDSPQLDQGLSDSVPTENNPLDQASDNSVASDGD